LKSVRPEPVEGWAGFDRLSPNGVNTSLCRFNKKKKHPQNGAMPLSQYEGIESNERFYERASRIAIICSRFKAAGLFLLVVLSSILQKFDGVMP
jgi:hypothetical protein